jgi:hypothetical protein
MPQGEGVKYTRQSDTPPKDPEDLSSDAARASADFDEYRSATARRPDPHLAHAQAPETDLTEFLGPSARRPSKKRSKAAYGVRQPARSNTTGGPTAAGEEELTAVGYGGGHHRRRRVFLYNKCFWQRYPIYTPSTERNWYRFVETQYRYHREQNICEIVGQYKKNVCFPTRQRQCSAAIVNDVIRATLGRGHMPGKDINCNDAKPKLTGGEFEDEWAMELVTSLPDSDYNMSNSHTGDTKI